MSSEAHPKSHRLWQTLSTQLKIDTIPLGLLCCLLYVGILLCRFSYGLMHISFSQDQARDSVLMEQAVQKGNYVIGYGPKASVGNFYLPPFYYQIHLWLSVLTGFQPVIMQWTIIVVESMTPVLLFLLLWRLTTRTIALSLAAVYSVALIPFTYGTFAWNPNMIPFFSTLSLLAAYELLFKNKAWGAVVVPIAFTIAFHLHYQSTVMLPFLGLVFLYDLYKYRLKHVPYWLIGIGLSLLTIVPYVVVEAQHNWINTIAIKNYFTLEHSRYFDNVSKPAFVLSFLPAFAERILLATTTPYFWLGRIIFLAGFLGMLWAARKDDRARFVFVYLISIFIMLRVYKGIKLDYYMSTIYILPALLLAYVFKWLPKLCLLGLLPIMIFCIHGILIRPQANELAPSDYVTASLRANLPSQEFSVLFHDPELTNLFAYNLNQLDKPNIHPGAKYLVDVCGYQSPCSWNGKLMCQFNKPYTYSELLKQKAGYRELVSIQSPPTLQIKIGVLDRSVTNLGYELYPANANDFGNDLLVSGQYRN